MKAKLVEREKGTMRSAVVEIKKKKSLIRMMSAVAELETKDEGKKVYITCEWMDQNPDELYFEAVTESIYDFLTYKRDDIEVLDEIQENMVGEYFSMAEILDSRFSGQGRIVSDELKSLLEEEGIETEESLWI